ncbi:MAG: Fe(3+) ABC transporter substrate-binding protein [Alphaproteobacteria bacterium]|nr:Fe(3+) ABC transporter substrate-binding protein [Alphaproteobacteria bacterium]
MTLLSAPCRCAPVTARIQRIFLFIVALTLPMTSTATWANDHVNIYSYREPTLMKPLIDAFTAETGLKVNMIYAKSGLIERLQAEGKNSPADVLLTNEFSLLTQAKDAGVTQPITSETLATAIPQQLRDSDSHWFGLTRRARVIYASKERVKVDAISYEDLADPKWRGRICTRSGQHTYNVALFASMIAHHGRDKAKSWLEGLKANLAHKPAGGDREGVRDIYSGVCDIAIGNSYYMAAMMRNPKQKTWADAVRILFPNADGRGTHVNISGAALAANAPNTANGTRFIEYLSSKAAQKIYAELISEYPVVAGVEASDIVKSWGALKADPLPLEKIGKLRRDASRMVDEVNYNSGPNS